MGSKKGLTDFFMDLKSCTVQTLADMPPKLLLPRLPKKSDLSQPHVQHMKAGPDELKSAAFLA